MTDEATAPIRTGLIGFGLAGATFHAPLIAAQPRIVLTAVVTSRVEQAGRIAPGASIYANAAALIADPAIELVVVTTPDATHAWLVRQAIEAGKHVVVEKPFTSDAAEGDELVRLAASRGRVLSLFHNRRWDSDFLTVRDVAESGVLGEIRFAELCWDRFRPERAATWREDAGDPYGVLMNIGPHLVDQALLLFGSPEAVTGDLARQRPGATVPDFAEVMLHYGDTRVRLSASTLVAQPRPRFALHGSAGSFVKHGIDPQEAQLLAGMDPAAAGFGEEPAEAYGMLVAADGARRPVRSRKGDWVAFYAGLAAAIRDGGPPPIDARDAVAGLAIIEAARLSHEQGRRIAMKG